ncbi:MAG: 3-methyl-2-oxobutanoate hydroxymethyltransferase [Candidatus Eremiobacter antarcticus]|nr:3-methyl-2-oxobutanoate hydroxymethyltransferase [Candidatus Eremiobacteraeota bacterium]MBC5807975.1 3-methyl-2-oxobutanoate hydroxymethyltransferase [Candidatus Eremiobacteraeota bacterium]PZR62664.1 MAG: 3-methyl-2-oxobutanoate hydroxymethyltransferase [Candidatus Eremiobacter sp. RRmetagenome_bin22]
MPTTTRTFAEKKRRAEKIAIVTAYDALTAAMVHAAGVDAILVGDSAAMVFAGHETTLPATMEQMLYHTSSVARGARGAFVIADMPFLSFQCGLDDAVRNAGRFLKEAGAHAVKIEGCDGALVQRLVAAGIPVMGHVGLTPQSVHAFGGFRAQGKTPETAARVHQQALALDAAGCFAIVLECLPTDLAERITQSVRAATIGIGAGVPCDGQVSVINDLLGLSTGYLPKHAKRYARFYDEGLGAVRQYIDEVRAGAFPGVEHSIEAAGEAGAPPARVNP